MYGTTPKSTAAIRHQTKKFDKNLVMTFVPFLNVCTWNTFSITSTVFIKTLSLPRRKKVMETRVSCYFIETKRWKDLCSGI